MRSVFRKTLLWLITISITLEPVFVLLPQNVSAQDAAPESLQDSNPYDESDIRSNADSDDLGDEENYRLEPGQLENIEDVKTKEALDPVMDAISRESDITVVGDSAEERSAARRLAAILEEYTPYRNLVTYDDFLAGQQEAKIVLSAGDLEVLRAMHYISKVAPDFSEDSVAMFNSLNPSTTEAGERLLSRDDIRSSDGVGIVDEATMQTIHNKWQSEITIDSDNAVERGDNEDFANAIRSYFVSLKQGGALETNQNKKIVNKELFHDFVQQARRDFAESWSIDNVTSGTLANLNKNDLMAISGYSESEIDRILQDKPSDSQPQGGDRWRYFAESILDIVKNSQIDIRVLKTLVYLVTPKSEGGAGHWRIRARKIVQTNSKLSHESDSVRDATCSGDGTQSAASCGESINNEGTPISGASADIQDSSGNVTGQAVITDEPEEILSAHGDGQAVDISEIDDIRCTVIKYRHIGHSFKEKRPATPVKLAWQTTEGYASSGGNNPIDIMGMIRSSATESLQNFANDLGADAITDFEGDLSQSGFSDIVGLFGKSMMASAVNSASLDFFGDNVEETLRNLGSVYFADYLGIPRNLFVGTEQEKLASLDYVSRVIGQAAIEKRLNIPFGSLSTEVKLSTADASTGDSSQPTIYSGLEAMMLNTGLRKLEWEMILDPGDLDNMFWSDPNKQIPIQTLHHRIGSRIIEKKFNLDKGMLDSVVAGKDLAYLKTRFGERARLLFIDPTYFDNILSLNAGTTKLLFDGQTSPSDYIATVGRRRYLNTVRGLRHLSSTSSAYAVPPTTPVTTTIYSPDNIALNDCLSNPQTCRTFTNPDGITVLQKTENIDTWNSAILGRKEAIENIGTFTVARLLAHPQDYTPEEANRINQVGLEHQQLDDGVSMTIDPKDKGVGALHQWIIANQQKYAFDHNDGFNGRTVTSWDKKNAEIPNSSTETCRNGIACVRVRVNSVFMGESSTPTETDTIGAPVNVNVHTPVYNVYPAGEADAYISEEPGRKLDLNHGDLYRLFGYAEANGEAVFRRIGQKLLFYMIANKALAAKGQSSSVKLNLSETNPRLIPGSDTAIFYFSRFDRALQLARTIKGDWENEREPGFDRIIGLMNELDREFQVGSQALLTLNLLEIANTVRANIYLIDQLTIALEEKRLYATHMIEKINKTIRDVNELIKVTSEFLSGQEIPSAELLTVDQIRTDAFAKPLRGRPRAQRKINPLVILDFLAGRITPLDFFVLLGANQLEARLGLPQNTLVYYIQNSETMGIANLDTFYVALGQARIEEEYELPRYYFQGYVVPGDRKVPDFRRDWTALKRLLVNRQDSAKYRQEVGWTGIYPALFPLAKTDSYSFDERLISDFDNRMKAIRESEEKKRVTNKPYTDLIKDAEKLWQDDRKHEREERYSDEGAERGRFGDIDLGDLLKNLTDRNYASTEPSAQSNLMFSLRMPGNYTALTQGSTIAWETSGAKARAAAIDKQFGLAANTTHNLFTGDTVLAPSGTKILSQSEKDLANYFGGMSIGAVETYLQVLNNELPFADLQKLGLVSDYNFQNRYALQEDAPSDNECPVLYAQVEPGKPSGKGKFSVNYTTIEPDTYSYYDKRGRHTFKSRREAERYSNEHVDDRIDVVGHMAKQLKTLYGPILGRTAGGQLGSGDKWRVPSIDFNNESEIADNLRLLLMKNIGGLFTLADIRAINEATDANDLDGDGDRSEQSIITVSITLENGETKDYTLSPNTLAGSPYDPGVLEKLFMRKKTQKPLQEFKKAVGQVEAEKAVSWKLFSELVGVKIRPEFFGPDDLYSILHGDMRPIYRIGSYLIEKEMHLPQHSIALLMSALSGKAKECQLSQIGANVLGGLVGLKYLPLNFNVASPNDMAQAIGQAKIEETLGLPRKTFSGDSLLDIINRIGPITFALVFNIPVGKSVISNQNTIFSDSVGNNVSRLDAILGNEANQVRNTSGRYKLKKIHDFLISNHVINDLAGAGVESLENELIQQTIHFVQNYATYAGQQLPDRASSTEIEFAEEVKNFTSQVNSIDSLLKIDRNSTLYLLSTLYAGDNQSEHGPNKFREKVGWAHVQKLITLRLAELLNIDTEREQAAADIITGIASYFHCSEDDTNQVTGQCENSNYGNVAWLFSKLSTVFVLRLDERAGFPTGTFDQMIKDPVNAPMTLLKIGANKLDAKLQRDPSRIFSFTGSYRFINQEYQQSLSDGSLGFISDYRDQNIADQQCHAQYYPNGLDMRLDSQYKAVLAVYNEPAPSRTEHPEEYQAWYDRHADASDQLYSGRSGTIGRTISDLNTQYNNCVESKRERETVAKCVGETPAPGGTCTTGGGSGNNIFRDLIHHIKLGIAEEIVYAIRHVADVNGVPVGVEMPKEDMYELLFRGDIRFLYIAATAFTVNFITAIVEGDESRQPWPPALRITYGEIRLVYIGDPRSDQAARDAATIAFANTYTPGDINVTSGDINASLPGSPHAPPVPNGEVCPPNAPTGSQCIPSDSYRNGTATGTGLDPRSNATQMGNVYGVNTNDPTLHARAEAYTTSVLGNVGSAWSNLQTAYGEEPQRGAYRNDAEYQSAHSTWEERIGEYPSADNPQGSGLRGQLAAAGDRRDELNRRRDEAEGKSRAIYRNNLIYKTFDAALWKVDKNIFPGFTRALMAGSLREKQLALLTYLENGLKNGNLFFGVLRFDAIPAELVGVIDDFVHIFLLKDRDWNSFLTGSGAKVLAGFVSNNSRKWFNGLYIPPDMIIGLMVGITTGEWGFDFSSRGDTITPTATVNGVKLPTLGSALMSIVETRIFSWADTKLGLPPGTVSTAFKMVVKIYKATMLYFELQHAIGIYSQITNLQGIYDAAEAAGAGADVLGDISGEISALEGKIDPSTLDALDANQAGNGEMLDGKILDIRKLIAAAIAELITFAIMQAIQKLFGEEIGRFEESMGLVPGSTMVLINFVVGELVVMAVNAVAGSALLPAAGPIGFGIAVILFIAINLWGIHKIEIKCNADGQYVNWSEEKGTYTTGPDGQPLTSQTLADYDVTPIGWWEKRVTSSSSFQTEFSELMKQKTILTARYKANRLIKDMLEMQNSSRFRDETGKGIVPTQIMIGRAEDAKNVEQNGDMISRKMCQQRLGKDSVAVETRSSETGELLGYVCGDRDTKPGGTPPTKIGIWKNLQTTAWSHIGF